MKSLVLLLAVSAVSAIPQPSTVVELDASAFPTFHPVPLEVFRATHDEEEPPPPPAKGGATLSSVNSLAAAVVCDSSNTRTRVEWRNYPAADRTAFVAAIRCLINTPASGSFPPATNRFEDLARLHQLMRQTIHQNHTFLLWHRFYLWVYEQLLRDECGFDRPFPWWDETLDAGRFAQSDLFTNANYFGNLPTDGRGRPVCVTTGAFAGLVCNIGPGTNNVPHCLSRVVDESLTSQCTTSFINYCNSRTTFSTMSECAEGGPHAYGHNGMGGVVSDVAASPSDPIFYMHHAFVDRAFWAWQSANPSRLTTVNGFDASRIAVTLNTVLSVRGIRPDVRVGDILNTLGGAEIGGVPFCYQYDR